MLTCQHTHLCLNIVVLTCDYLLVLYEITSDCNEMLQKRKIHFLPLFSSEKNIFPPWVALTPKSLIYTLTNTKVFYFSFLHSLIQSFLWWTCVWGIFLGPGDMVKEEARVANHSVGHEIQQAWVWASMLTVKGAFWWGSHQMRHNF